MAVITTLSHSGTSTSSLVNHGRENETFAIAKESKEKQSDGERPERHTVAKVDATEKGDETKKDTFADSDAGADPDARMREATCTRRTAAQNTSTALSRLISSHGSVKMATDLQLLRRQLSRCHGLLEPFRSERDYLSIVVLVELELGSKDWKEITKDELVALKKAIDIGVKEEHVTFNHYGRVLRVLNASGFVTGPSFEFAESESPGKEPLDEPPDE
jgi:hypothetical protein